MSARAACAALIALAIAAAWKPAAAQNVKLHWVSAVYADASTSGLLDPEGVGCAKDRVIVADTGNARLVEYQITGDKLVASREIKLSSLPAPGRVQISSKGEMLVIDGKQRKVARLSAAGAFVDFVPLGDGTRTVIPRAIALDRADNLYVLDAYGARVLVIAPDGTQVREIALPADYGFMSDLTVDGGTVFLIDSIGKRLYAAGEGASAATPVGPGLGDEADFPGGIVADRQGTLLVSDRHGGGIVALGRDGTFRGRQLGFGWKPGLLRSPAQACIAGDHLVVADEANNRVQVFALVQ